MQRANIAIVDGKAAPVTHTFVPSKIGETTSVFYGPGATLAGRERITITRREATATVAGKVSIKLETPIERTVDGTVRVEYSLASYQEFVLAPMSVKQDRKDLRLLSANLLLNPLVVACIDDMESVS